MFYYLFKVRTNKPELIPDYYILNNRYIGYIGYDSYYIRSILETNAKIKNQYQLIAIGNSPDFDEVHDLFCKSHRFTEEGVNEFIEKYKFQRTKCEDWYKEYYPIKNSSETILKSVDENKVVSVILDDGLILPLGEFKKNKNKYLK